MRYEVFFNSQATKGTWTNTYSRSISGYFNDLLQNIDEVRVGAPQAKYLSATVRREDGKMFRYTNELDWDTKTTVNQQWSTDADIFYRLESVNDVATGELIALDLYTPDETRERYDLLGKLQSIHYVDGREEILEYAPDTGKLQTVTDSLGKTLSFAYDGPDTTITVPGNEQYQLDYSGGNLLSITYPDQTPGDDTDNPKRQYHYENVDYPNHLTGITDERGIRYATYEYDADGQATASYLAGNADRVDVAYNADGTRTVTNSRQHSTTYATTNLLGVPVPTNITGPACASCGGSNTSYSYYPADSGLDSYHLQSKTDNGVITRYGDYDANGNRGYKIEAVGTPQQRRTDYTYDPRFHGKVKKIIEPSVYAQDPTAQCTEGVDCKVTEYTYDDFGNRTAVTITGFTPTGTPVTRTTVYQYNGPLNQLSQIDGPRSDVSDITTLNYYPDDAGQGNNRAQLKEIIDANGVTVRGNIQYTAFGKILSEERPNGLSLSYTYYPRGRLETLTETSGTSSRTTRWTYLATGEVETVTQAYGTADATTITFGYDDARRLTRVEDGLGNYIKYTLDTEGNKEFEEIYDNGDVLKKSLAQTFDAYNRLNVSTQQNESSDYDFNPNGTLGALTDGESSLTDYDYDSLKRLTAVTQDLGGINAKTFYDYDTQDNLTSVIDPNNGVTVYGYDDLGNLLAQISPDTGATTFGYDGAGNLTSKTDAKGQAFTYHYDALNRLYLLDAPGSNDDIQYDYDTCANGVGRLCAVTVNSGGASPIQTTYSYTGFGEVESHQGLSYGYDSAGRLETMIYPSGAVVTYHYDSAGRINQVDLDQDGTFTTLASNISYKPFGPITGLTYGNGKVLIQGFDTAYRMTSQDIAGVLNVTYPVYDANGNLRRQIEDASANDYTYDALNRLDTAIGNFGSQDFGYDKVGNRLAEDNVTQSYIYEPNSNRLDMVNGFDVQLDANGNTTVKGAQAFSYTVHNRLKAVRDGGALLATYTYNGLGQRVRKSHPYTPSGDANGDNLITVDDLQAVIDEILGLDVATGNPDCNGDGLVNVADLVCINNRIASGGVIFTGSKVFAYGLNGQLVGEYDGATNAPLQEIIYLGGRPLAVLRGGNVYYVHADHLGTPRAVMDDTGAIIWRWESDPFGSGLPDGDVDGDGVLFTLNLRFPGQYYDQETGLHYNYFRYYDPRLGRYLTSDPLGLAGGMNTYAYVLNNPLNFIDPLGLAVGDWWDFPANLERARQIAREELARRPRSHNDIGDAMRHAEWMRRTTQETNACTAWLAGTGHEIEGLLGGQPWAEAIMDLHNNAVGRNAGSNNTPVDPSKLWTLPNNGSDYNLYQGVR